MEKNARNTCVKLITIVQSVQTSAQFFAVFAVFLQQLLNLRNETMIKHAKLKAFTF